MKEYIIKLLVTLLIGVATIFAGILLLILSPIFAYKANRNGFNMSYKDIWSISL